ncbi:unnamed protein product [Orchesella dallaii]|uniref:Uncharacterized protein n=1 Tax=Orchesella dallaii TaxID=48710 RepID=A0ABP1RK21_9HEXA
MFNFALKMEYGGGGEGIAKISNADYRNNFIIPEARPEYPESVITGSSTNWDFPVFEFIYTCNDTFQTERRLFIHLA